MSTALAGTTELEQLQFDYDVAATAVDDAVQAMQRGLANFRSAVVADVNEAEGAAADLSLSADGVEDAIGKVAVARGSAKKAAYHAPSVKLQGADIVAAIKQLAAWERQLLKLDTAVKAQVAGAEKTMDAQWKLVFAFHDRVSRALKSSREFDDLFGSLKLALDTSYANAVKAVQHRRAESLSLHQSDAKGYATKKLATLAAGLAAVHDEALALMHRLGPGPKQGRKKDLDAIAASREQARTGLPALLQRQKDIAAMKVEAVDLAKAVKTLGLPAAYKAELGKAMAADDAACLKALDQIGRETKSALDGKAMLQALKKAKLV